MLRNTNSLQSHLIELLGELIAFDTTSNKSVLPIADYLANYLADGGCEVERFHCDEPGKVNLLARKGPDLPQGLTLCGHLDVVPADEPEWQSDPFRLLHSEDRLVGRGTVDMKSFIAMAACILESAEANRLQVPLVGLFTCDEEIGTQGAASFVRQWDSRWQLPQATIIGEPTELRVVRMHKGHLRLRVTTHGRSAHSGYPCLGSNAIEKMGKVVTALGGIANDMRSESCVVGRFFDDVPHAVLNQGVIMGGSAVNIIPDRTTLEIGLRILPGERSEDYVQRISQTLSALELAEGDVTLEVVSDSPPLLTSEEAEVCQRLCDYLQQEENAAVHYASDAGPLAELGLECVLWGPGSIAVAHRPNEYLLKAELTRAFGLLAGFVQEWCYRSDGH